MPNERRQGGVVLGGEVGLDLLLEALRFFRGARIELIGERPLAPELAQHPQLSLAGGLEGEDLQARLECAAYLVVPAVNGDPLPRELIEGFANGLPAIAPAEGAAAELVAPGRNGLLFEPGSARDLARRLAWAEAFPEKMRQMGECARADYLARFIDHWSYQKLYGERRRTARL